MLSYRIDTYSEPASQRDLKTIRCSLISSPQPLTWEALVPVIHDDSNRMPAQSPDVKKSQRQAQTTRLQASSVAVAARRSLQLPGRRLLGSSKMRSAPQCLKQHEAVGHSKGEPALHARKAWTAYCSLSKPKSTISHTFCGFSTSAILIICNPKKALAEVGSRKL